MMLSAVGLSKASVSSEFAVFDRDFCLLLFTDLGTTSVYPFRSTGADSAARNKSSMSSMAEFSHVTAAGMLSMVHFNDSVKIKLMMTTS